MDIKNFKVNCSSICALLGKAQGNNPVTENEFKRLVAILGKEFDQLSEPQKQTAWDILTKEINYDSDKLSDSTTTELAKLYAYEMYGKSKISKGNDSPWQLEKGILGEPAAIHMLSEHDGVSYVKNEELFENKWFKGIPGIIIRNAKGKVKKVIDVKVSYDLPSFLLTTMRREDTGNIFEIMGYMDLLGCEQGEIIHCLIDSPDSMIKREEKRSMQYYEDFGVAKDLATQRMEQRKHSMVFPEFTIEQKIHRYSVALNKLSIRDAKSKVTKAKKWINELHDKFTKPLNLQK